MRFSLFTKILLWFFLNLLLLGAILFFVFNLNFRFNVSDLIFGETANNVGAISNLMTGELAEKSNDERGRILKRYAEAYNVDFSIFDLTGKQIAGRETVLPREVLAEIASHPLPPPLKKSVDSFDVVDEKGVSHIRSPIFSVKSRNPTTFWRGTTVYLFEKNDDRPRIAILLAASDSVSGNGFFFDVASWFLVATVVFVVSALFWLPFVRDITKSISQVTNAAEQIAEQKFDVRVNENRTDEIGRLGKSINHLAARLNGFVNGQKRFLGDISHELNSPLARMQFALAILENRVDAKNLPYIEDVKEEIVLMSKLVAELLDYSKVGIKSNQIKLENVNLRSLIKEIVERETSHENAEIDVDVDENMRVVASPELLGRAIANVVRNAVRYAGNAGTIFIKAETIDKQQVKLTIADKGAGVPEREIEKMFDPFHRIESDRSRETGGAGLGLAIVKTCVEACKGKVSAKNRNPHGLEITIFLQSANRAN